MITLTLTLALALTHLGSEGLDGGRQVGDRGHGRAEHEGGDRRLIGQLLQRFAAAPCHPETYTFFVFFDHDMAVIESPHAETSIPEQMLTEFVFSELWRRSEKTALIAPPVTAEDGKVKASRAGTRV